MANLSEITKQVIKLTNRLNEIDSGAKKTSDFQEITDPDGYVRLEVSGKSKKILASNFGGSMSDAKVKEAYENNANTNEFNDAEKLKLNGLKAKFIDGMDSNNAIYLDGKVGVGLISPTEDLEVSGNIKASDTAILGRNDSNTDGSPKPFIKVITGRWNTQDMDKVSAGSIYQDRGNLYYNNGGSVGNGYTSSGSIRTNKRQSITGLGLDGLVDIQGGVNFNELLSPDSFGYTSLIKLGYTYGKTLAQRGCTNVHPNTYSGVVFNFKANVAYAPQVQVWFDNKGQIFTRGAGSYSNTRIQQFVSEGVWRDISLYNGWVNLDSETRNIAQYKVEGKTVTLRGNISGGLQNQVIGVIGERHPDYGSNSYGEFHKTIPKKATRRVVTDDLGVAIIEIVPQEILPVLNETPSTAHGDTAGIIYKQDTLNGDGVVVNSQNVLLLSDNTTRIVKGRTKIIMLTNNNTNIDISLKYDTD